MFVSQDNEVGLSNDGPRSIDTNRCTRTHTHTYTPRDLRFFDGYSAGQKFPSLPVACEVISIIYRSKRDNN